MKVKRIIRSLIFIILVFTVSQSHSQQHFINGYIVDLKGDTIKGQIDYQNWDRNPEIICFKVSDSLPLNFFHPIDIKGFGVENDHYLSQILWIDDSSVNLNELNYIAELRNRKDTVFLKVLISGTKSLYFLEDFKKEHFFIDFNGEIKELNRVKYLKEINGKKNVTEISTYKGQLIAYFADYQALHPGISKIKYSKNSFIELFSDYYKINPKSLFYQMSSAPKDLKIQKEARKNRIEIGINIGVSLTKLKFKGNNNPELVRIDFPLSTNLTGGLFLNFVIPRYYGKWSINNELTITSFKTHGEYHTSRVEKINFEISYFKLNNMFRYKYPYKKIFIFFDGGISNGFMMNNTNLKTIGVNKFEAIEWLRKVESCVLLGVGGSYQSLSIGYRIEKGNGITYERDLKSTSTRNYFLLGYKF